MKVSWKNFPDNTGHMYSLGCFRCHDGKHVSDDGKVLSKDCNLCHLLLKAAPKPDSGSPLGALGSALPGGAGGLASVAGSFKALGLSPDMVSKFVPVLTQFVQSKGGANVGSLLAGAFK